MKPEEVYLAWAPPDSIWSPWAIPVPFAQIVCVLLDATREMEGVNDLAGGLSPAPDLAVILDSPGDQAVQPISAESLDPVASEQSTVSAGAAETMARDEGLGEKGPGRQ